VLTNFSHDDIVVEYFDDIDEINYDKCDFIIIINDKNNVDIVKCVKIIRKKFNKIIYLIDKEYDNFLLSHIFDYGIDDYLLYPVVNEYLIQKICKDFYKDKSNNISCYQYQDLKIDFKAHVVMIKYEEINLTNLEYELLKFLISNVNISIPKKEILKKVWGFESEDYRTLETHIKTLRKKLKGYKKNIVTIWSYGYLFSENI